MYIPAVTGGKVELILYGRIFSSIATVLRQKNDAAIEDNEKRLNDLQIQLLKLASAYADITQIA